MGPVEKEIRDKLQATFLPLHLEVENESSRHAVPAGSESHFRAVVVSSRFENQSRLERQRAVLSVVERELKNGVHAFTMRLVTPDEWNKAGGEPFVSPPCHGGSKTGR